MITAVALIAAVLWLAAPAERGSATFRGKPGAIAFARAPFGKINVVSDIWVAHGRRERRLTHSPSVAEESPAYSKRGGMIVYARRAEGDSDIWVMRSDGSHKRPVVTGDTEDQTPQFFPSGRSIVFARYLGTHFDLYTVRLDGSRLMRFAVDGSHPAISNDGRLLAYSLGRSGGGIELVNLRTGESRRLTHGSAQELDFSPNGRSIVFTGARPCRGGGEGNQRFGILTVDIASGRIDRVRVGCEREWISPAFAPNGRRIIAVRKKPGRTRRDLRFNLVMLDRGGHVVGGQPRAQRGSDDLFPAWQALRR